MRVWLVVGLLHIIGLVASIDEYEEPDTAYDTTIHTIIVNKRGTRMIVEMNQQVPDHFTYDKRSITHSYSITVDCLNTRTLRFALTDSVHTSYRMPETDPFPNTNNLRQKVPDEFDEFVFKPHNSTVELSYCQSSVYLTQKSNYVQLYIVQQQNTIILTGFRVESKMLVFQMKVFADFVMGLGQRNGKFKIESGKYTLWAKDNLHAVQRQQPCQNTYGYHPVMLFRNTYNQNYQLLYIRSTSALEFEIEHLEKSMSFMTYLHGNSMEMIMFSNQSPHEVVEQYHEYIGLWKLPPLWTFGFHQSRWGYDSAQRIGKVVEGYKNAELKLQSIFLDIDYMQNKKPFKIDTKKFPTEDLLRIKKSSEIKLVPIVDYAFNYDFASDIDPVTKAYIFHNKPTHNLFIKNHEGNLCVGEVWPGVSIFPDFHHPNISHFWQPYLSYLREHIPFDGVWLDMNQVANFKKPQKDFKQYESVFLQCGEHLSNMTLPMSATHYNGEHEFYMHNINGIKQQQITQIIAQKIFEDQFYLISRNTFPGSGKYGGHWSGDNEAKWQFMDYSISSLLNFNIFGIPFSGSDVCGFFGDYEQKLCSRWIQVNSLFPLFRNHNHINSKDQQFFAIGQNIKTSIRNNMNLRYSLLKYIYNIFVIKRGRGMVYYPMLFDFPSESVQLSESQVIEHQVMVGRKLFFSSSKTMYFPKNVTWFNLNEEDIVVDAQNTQRVHTLQSSSENSLPVFVREGSIILQQEANHVLRVNQLDNNYNLKCFLDRNNECRTTFHDEYFRKASSDNRLLEQFVYEVIGKAQIEDGKIKSVSFKLQPYAPSTPLLRLRLNKLVVVSQSTVSQCSSCIAIQQTTNYNKKRSCSCTGNTLNRIEIRKYDRNRKYLLSLDKSLLLYLQ